MSSRSKGHLPDCEVPYNGGDCDCAWHWEEMVQVNKNETLAERKARLYEELTEIEAEEVRLRTNHMQALLSGLIKMLPDRTDQQTFRNMLTEHIKATYDGDDE
jgi:N-acetylmuramic acid 6-phosphate (MurNAc-6-P) etherase